MQFHSRFAKRYYERYIALFEEMIDQTNDIRHLVGEYMYPHIEEDQRAWLEEWRSIHEEKKEIIRARHRKILSKIFFREYILFLYNELGELIRKKNYTDEQFLDKCNDIAEKASNDLVQLHLENALVRHRKTIAEIQTNIKNLIKNVQLHGKRKAYLLPRQTPNAGRQHTDKKHSGMVEEE